VAWRCARFVHCFETDLFPNCIRGGGFRQIALVWSPAKGGANDGYICNDE